MLKHQFNPGSGLQSYFIGFRLCCAPTRVVSVKNQDTQLLQWYVFLSVFITRSHNNPSYIRGGASLHHRSEGNMHVVRIFQAFYIYPYASQQKTWLYQICNTAST